MVNFNPAYLESQVKPSFSPLEVQDMIEYVIYVVTWDQLVMQCFLVVCLGYPTRNLNFLSNTTHSPKAIQTLLKTRVYTEKAGAHNPERAT